MDLTCEQTEKIMHYYINDELNLPLKEAFEKHLTSCEKCRKKYEALNKIIFELKEAYRSVNKLVYAKNNEQASINTIISAYIDNELDIEDNIKVKKMIITKPNIREKFDKIYNLKQLLKNSFDKTQPNEDFSRKLLRDIIKINQNNKGKDFKRTIISFIILSIIWIIMLISVIK